ncbi:MAG: amidohydrolase family protein, partial [Clostridia bacterium]|nr:amidohydrolase family protein [Clostridia bacterium]
MSLFEITENDKRIFETELKDFLPDEIFDVHAHVWLKSMDRRKAVEGAEKRTVTWPSLVAQDNSIEDYLETNCLLFPGKKVSALIFANEGESEGKNDYVAEAAKRAGFPALYFSRPELSADEIEERIREKGFIGIKSYLDLAPKYIPEGEIRVFDFFPKHQLERINRMKGIVMLHIPRSGRLKDPVNIAQIAEIKELYPDIKLIIAHI